jgi:hypothetical protein
MMVRAGLVYIGQRVKNLVPDACSAMICDIVPFLFREYSAPLDNSSNGNGMQRCALFRGAIQSQSHTVGTHSPPIRGQCSATAVSEFVSGQGT